MAIPFDINRNVRTSLPEQVANGFRLAIAVSSLAFAVSAFATPPTVSDVAMPQNTQTCPVTVAYRRSGGLEQRKEVFGHVTAEMGERIV